MAVMAVVMVNSYLNRERQKYVKKTDERLVPVVIANQDIPRGSTIVPGMVTQVPWPEQFLQPKAYNNPEYVFGKIAITDILKGEMILQTKLTTAKNPNEGSLAVRLPPGKRAFTIKIDALSAVVGEIRPSDKVDIIGNFPFTQNVDGKPVTENVSVTLFQNVLVMDVKPSGNELIFILAVTPQEAGILSYAMGIGSLKLTLRHTQDENIETVPPVESNVLWQYILSSFGTTLFQPQPVNKEQGSGKTTTTTIEEENPTLEIFKGTQKGTMVVK